MVIEFEFTEADKKMLKPVAPNKKRSLAREVIYWTALIGSLVLVFRYPETGSFIRNLWITAGRFFALSLLPGFLIFVFWAATRKGANIFALKDGDPDLLGFHRITLNESFLQEETAGNFRRINWQAFTGIFQKNGLVTLVGIGTSSIMIPTRIFANDDAVAQFIKQADQLRKQAQMRHSDYLEYASPAAHDHFVQFTITREHLLAFHLAGINNPELKMTRLKLHAFIGVLALIELVGVIWDDWESWMSPSYLVIALLITLVLQLALWVATNHLAIYLAHKASANAKLGDGLLGDHSLSLTELGIIEVTSADVTYRAWNKIIRTEMSERFIRIYTTPHSCFFIPMNSFSSPVIAEKFSQTVEMYRQAANRKLADSLS